METKEKNTLVFDTREVVSKLYEEYEDDIPEDEWDFEMFLFWQDCYHHMQKFIDKNKNIFLVDADIELWNGSYSSFKFFYVYDAEALIARFSRDAMDFRIEIDYDKNVMSIYKYHHDGTNVYDLIPFNDLSKNYMRELYKEAYDEYPDEDLTEDEMLEEITQNYDRYEYIDKR